MKIFKNKKTVVFAVIICVAVFFFVRRLYNNTRAFYNIQYAKTDISQLIRKEKLSPRDYDIIYKNTGVSPNAAKELISAGRLSILDTLNDLYFKQPYIVKNYIAYPVTAEEKINGEAVPLVNLKNGDILVTFNTHTLDWRHGHCAIVVDARHEVILEHVSLGNVSSLGNVREWGTYPGFLILRHKDTSVADKAAKYAKENLVGIDYSIFAGITDKDKSDNDTDIKSHCSHIVWQSYMAAEVDIDKNSGQIVTPKDIAMSDKLDVVQIYGINPEEFNKRICK